MIPNSLNLDKPVECQFLQIGSDGNIVMGRFEIRR